MERWTVTWYPIHGKNESGSTRCVYRDCVLKEWSAVERRVEFLNSDGKRVILLGGSFELEQAA